MKKILGFFFVIAAITVMVIIFLRRDQYVVLVSMDAFRWDYDQTYETPNLDRFAAEGVKAKSLIPGMTQLLSKRPDMFSLGVWPGYFSKAKDAY